MREDAFRAFLTPRLSGAAVASYLANLRAVERLLHIDAERVALDAVSLRDLKYALENAGMPPSRAADCGSALRQYAAFRSGDVAASPNPPNVAAPRSAFISQVSVGELMRVYAEVLEELRARAILRTANGSVGDYAEALFAKAFGWTLASNSAAHYDATDANGLRYQIKGRRLIGSGSRQLGAIRNLPDAQFDDLAAVLFDRNMQVLRAALIPFCIVCEQAKRSDHTNSWRFMLSDAVWAASGVRDATEQVKAAALTL